MDGMPTLTNIGEDAIRTIATFSEVPEGKSLYLTCRWIRGLLHEGVRKFQIALVCGIAERIQKSGILSHERRKTMNEEKDRVVDEISKATSIERIAFLSRGFVRTITGRANGEDEVLMHPFNNFVDGVPQYQSQFMPAHKERRICQALISINRMLFVKKDRLETILNLLKVGRLDQTEEMEKVEREGKSCLLAGLARTVARDEPINLQLFFDIIKKITRKDLQEEILSFCMKRYPRCSLSNPAFLNSLTAEEFFFSLSPKMQEQLVGEIHQVDQDAALRLAFLSSDSAVKKKVLELQMDPSKIYERISTQPERLFLLLDVAKTLHPRERNGDMFAILERLEKICRGHRSDFASFNARWEREFRHLYKEDPTRSALSLTAALLKILLIDEEWKGDSIERIVEDSWEFLNRFPISNEGMCAYIFLMQISSHVQSRESYEEVSSIMFQKVNTLKDDQKRQFIRLMLAQGLDYLKDNEFVNYETLINQIKGTIRGMVQFQREVQDDLVLGIRILGFLAQSSQIDRGFYTKFYMFAGLLQEAFPRGAEKDEQIMKLYKLYKAHNMQEDQMAKKMMGELVEQIENKKTRGGISCRA